MSAPVQGESRRGDFVRAITRPFMLLHTISGISLDCGYFVEYVGSNTGLLWVV